MVALDENEEEEEEELVVGEVEEVDKSSGKVGESNDGNVVVVESERKDDVVEMAAVLVEMMALVGGEGSDEGVVDSDVITVVEGNVVVGRVEVDDGGDEKGATEVAVIVVVGVVVDAVVGGGVGDAVAVALQISGVSQHTGSRRHSSTKKQLVSEALA